MKVLRHISGNVNVYFIRQAVGWIMVDTGRKSKRRRLIRFMFKHEINPCEIKLIVLTHAHYDHVGNLAYLRKMTKARVLVHENDVESLKYGLMVMPKGSTLWARLVLALGVTFKMRLRFEPTEADEVVRSYHDLSGYGFDAHIRHTPGHSPGSISLIFNEGKAFVGDLCFNLRLSRRIFPPFYNDKKKLLNSWEALNQSRAQLIYPGHGRAFAVNRLHKAMRRLARKLEKE